MNKFLLLFLMFASSLILCNNFIYAQEAQISLIEESTNTVRSNDIEPGKYPLVKDNRIIKALDSLIGTDGEWARRAIAGYNSTNLPINVLFKDLSKISPQFKDFDALGWQDDNDKLLIFINEKHKNVPPEALGSLLSHESIHQDRSNSIQEETYGWTFEAEVWIQLKEKYPKLKTISPGEYPLIDRENNMEMLFRQANFTSKLIEGKVRSNFSYKTLPETSPGFGM